MNARVKVKRGRFYDEQGNIIGYSRWWEVYDGVRAIDVFQNWRAAMNFARSYVRDKERKL